MYNMKILIPTKYKEALIFILDMFIDTHDESAEIYPKELFIAKSILKKLKK